MKQEWKYFYATFSHDGLDTKSCVFKAKDQDEVLRFLYSQWGDEHITIVETQFVSYSRLMANLKEHEREREKQAADAARQG